LHSFKIPCNKIIELPKTLAQLVNLHELQIFGNPIKYIPNSIMHLIVK
jgi:Leucine-rich repeat (LRR) protein